MFTVWAMLYMATLSAIRFNPPIEEFYDRLMKAGKLHKVAMVAWEGEGGKWQL